MAREYICKISSSSNWGREYIVSTSSAMKCAKLFGRCEFDEVVSVYTKSGKEISRVRYSMDGNYYRVNV